MPVPYGFFARIRSFCVNFKMDPFYELHLLQTRMDYTPTVSAWVGFAACNARSFITALRVL